MTYWKCTECGKVFNSNTAGVMVEIHTEVPPPNKEEYLVCPECNSASYEEVRGSAVPSEDYYETQAGRAISCFKCKCGNKVHKFDNFCSGCGAALDWSDFIE